MNAPKTESTLVELTPEELAEASGAAPRGGWDVPPPPTLDTATASTTTTSAA